MTDTKLYSISLISITHEKPDITTFHFAKPDDYTFTAGQYTKICLSHDPLDKHWTRSMSFSSSPSESELTFTMHTNSGSEFKQKLLSLQIGESVDITEPMGHFILPKTFEKVYLIAGGVGITPFKSMLSELAATSPGDLEKIAFYHISSKSFLFEEWYNELPIHSAQANFEEMKSQLLSHQELLRSTKAPLYISGSPRFVVGVRKILTQIGVNIDHIKLDSFVGYKDLV